MADSSWPHGLQHISLLYPPLSPGVCSNACLSSWWCYLTISSSSARSSFCSQSFPASESFPMSQLFTLGDQSIGASVSASVLPMNIQDWFPLGWTGWISLLSKGLSRVFSNSTVRKHRFRGAQPSLWSVQLSHPYMINGKTIALTIWAFVSKVMCLFFNMLSRFVIVFLPRSKRLLISWLQSLSTVILEPEKIKSVMEYYSVFKKLMHIIARINFEDIGLSKVN